MNNINNVKSLNSENSKKNINNLSSLNNITFKVAQSVDELEAAFQLLHDSYVEMGYMNPHPDQLRILPQFFHPSSSVIVAKVGQKIIGTVTLIRDCKLGLPMEKIFDLSELRREGHRLTEVSSLAIHPDFRVKGGKILHQLISFIWNYAMKQHGSEVFVIAVNPSMAPLYEKIYLFKPLKNKSYSENYSFVNNAPAVGLFNNLTKSRSEFLGKYGELPTENNFYHLLFNSPIAKEIEDTSVTFYDINSQSASQEIVQYFLNKHSSWWQQLSPCEKNYFIENQLAIGRKDLIYPESLFVSRKRSHPRFDVALKISAPEFSNSIIFDASLSGIKFRNFPYALDRTHYHITCQIGPQKMTNLKLELRWSNENFSGFSIVDHDETWVEYLKFINDKINLKQPINIRKAA